MFADNRMASANRLEFGNRLAAVEGANVSAIITTPPKVGTGGELGPPIFQAGLERLRAFALLRSSLRMKSADRLIAVFDDAVWPA